MLKRGIYEQVRNREISKEIDDNNDIITKLEKIDQAESSAILAKYITEIIEKNNSLGMTRLLQVSAVTKGLNGKALVDFEENRKATQRIY